MIDFANCVAGTLNTGIKAVDKGQIEAAEAMGYRKFEAFFPLVMTAIIYFIIARIFVALLSAFAKKLEPKSRKRIVKGVKYSD